MKLNAFVGGLLVIAPLLCAQTGAQSSGVAGMEPLGLNGKTILRIEKLPNACPVGMQASHLSDGSVIKTDAAHPMGLGQRLRLTLTSPDNRSITSATVHVRGWTAQGRTEQAEKAKDVAPLTRRLQVPFKPGADRTATADVWVPGVTAVSSVELLSVTYGDGTTWTPAMGKTCQVKPDPLMLISGK